MARFLVTNGSNFQPLTYDEITRPLYEMAEAHRASQDAYDALSMQTESLRNYITDNPGDTKARTMYDNYVNRLQSLQDELWSTGYNTSTRRNLQLARNGFMSDINRIGKAIENRQARSAEYNKFKHEHPDMVMGEDPGLSGLDNYLDNDLYGTNWYQYSGLQFTQEVAADAGARIKEIFNDPQISKDPRLTGYIAVKKEQGATSEDVAKANAVVMSYLSGNADAFKNLELVPSVLAEVLMRHLGSTGASGNVSKDEFSRLVKYGMSGLSAAIGSGDTNYMQDLEWQKNMQFALANLNHQNAMEQIRERGRQDRLTRGGSGNGAGGSNGSTIFPNIVRLSGNSIDGYSTGKEGKEAEDRNNVYNALKKLKELKDTGNLLKGNGDYTPDANKAASELGKSEYFNSKIRTKYGSNWEAAISDIEKEISSSVRNDHMYQFEFKIPAHKNVMTTLLKPNIGQLSGPDGDSKAGSYAEYSDKKKLNAKELKSLMASDNVITGFDAKTGRVTLQRVDSDNKEDKDKYDDRVVFLDPTTLKGVYASAKPIYEIMYMSLPDDCPEEVKRKYENAIDSMSTTGNTIELSNLAKLVKSTYDSAKSSGDPMLFGFVNAMVRMMAVGIYDVSNSSWAENYFKPGWSDRTANSTGSALGDEQDLETDEYVDLF